METVGERNKANPAERVRKQAFEPLPICAFSKIWGDVVSTNQNEIQK